MTKRDILSIALKILGINFLINAVISINGIGMGISLLLEQAKHPGQQQNYDPYWFLGTTIVTLILWLAMACILLRCGDLIAKKLINDDAVVPLLSGSEWEKTIFVLSMRIIGLVCLVMGVRHLVKVLPELIISMERYMRNISAFIYGEIISAIALLVIGIYLLSDGRHLVKCAFKERVVDK